MDLKLNPQTSKRGAPHQARSQKTVTQILTAAADLLEEVGFEQLSTNLICKRAGVTPPALYRYFPNKYAVLKELGERLMARQNELLETWHLSADHPATLQTALEGFLSETVRVTRETKAGGWIMRSMHASPVLANVRIESHRRVSRALAEQFCAERPAITVEAVLPTIRLGVELGYAVVEMVFDEPEIDETTALRQTANLLAHNLKPFLEPEG